MATKSRNPKKSKGSDPTRRENDGALDIFSGGKFRSIKLMVSEAPGDAELAQSGSLVRTHYTAWLLAQQPKTSSGQAPELTQALIRKTKAAQPFDSTRSTKRSRPFTFRLGDGNVFEGCKRQAQLCILGYLKCGRRGPGCSNHAIWREGCFRFCARTCNQR